MALANLEGELDRKPVANVYWDVRVPWVEGIEHLPKLGGEQGNQPLKE